MLGIIDWGIGGVGIYKAIKEQIGDRPILYFSDTGVTPYGKMTRPELVSRLNAVVKFLASECVTHLAVGCNAASTAIDLIEPNGVRIEGMIESGVAAALKQKPSRLGLIGGRRTVRSGAYRKAFALSGLEIEQRIAQPLSGMIESGDLSSPKLREACRHILMPLRNCSHILIACTHYPAIIPVMIDFISAGTQFIDPSSELVDRIRGWGLPAGGKDAFLTSGSTAQMKSSAFKAFGVSLGEVQRVDLKF